MIQRIFHPIGQGAFYSERHKKFNIVYDCGNWKDTKLADKVVKQAFSEDDEVDVLFISHFDFDHVSKISTLKNHVKLIKNVVLPLLHQEEKILLSNVYRVLGGDILTMINNPQDYFGNETRLIFVSPSEGNGNVINENIEPQNINDLNINDNNRIEILGGQAISLSNDYDWVFIPYNFEYKKRNLKLIKELRNEGFDCNKLTSNPNYALDEIIHDLRLTKKQGGKKINAIYDKLSGRINQNSMILYSGPLRNQDYHKYCLQRNCYDWHYHKCCSFDKVGCVYTGDTDLKVVNIKTVLNYLWDKVGTIQIPHHGDINSFDNQVVSSGNYCCPISLGTNNSYGHPSTKVIGEIMKNCCCPVLVTEKLDSSHVEIIEIR